MSPPTTPPDAPLDIYLIAIGGSGMAPLACLLAAKGHRVRGSDLSLYPPMSTLLADAGIEPYVGWDGDRLAESPPDMVVVGNAVPRSNPEIVAMEELGLDRLSMPQTLAHFFLAERRPLVAAGTHGKTTTSSLAAWVWTACGRDPGYLVGGLPRNLPRSFAVGTGERFVVEGDEYNAAYFDRGPKFLHYRPHSLILTSAEYDHADLYPTPESLFSRFAELARLVPEDGMIAAYGDSAEVRRRVADAACPVVFYGFGEDNDLRPLDGVAWEGGGSRFTVADDEEGEVELRLGVPGEHNVLNALGVWAAARADGLPAGDVARAFAEFRGAARRLEELGTAAGVTVVDDFAHHPTAVAMSLRGLRDAYPGRRIVALFEPRSITAGRAFHFDAYREAFAHADLLISAPAFYGARYGSGEGLDVAGLCGRLADAGIAAECAADADAVFARALALVRPGDVVVTMSSGSFERMPHRVLEALRERPG